MIASNVNLGKCHEIRKCALVLTSHTRGAFCSDAPSTLDGPASPFICNPSPQNVFGSWLLYKRVNDS